MLKERRKRNKEEPFAKIYYNKKQESKNYADSLANYKIFTNRL